MNLLHISGTFPQEFKRQIYPKEMMQGNVLGNGNDQWYFCLYRFFDSRSGLRCGYINSCCVRL